MLHVYLWLTITRDHLCVMFVHIHVHVEVQCMLSLHIEPPLDAPAGVMVDDVGDTSVTVSWGAVSDAQIYSVTFTQASGGDQRGLCTAGSHKASVDAPSTSASIGVGQMLDGDDATMLRAYTTYSITVVAVSDERINSGNSQPITHTTVQIGTCWTSS